MSWFSALVLYAVIWFLTLFVVLPLRLVTQGEAGAVVPGTPESAPAEAHMKRRLVITTGVATVIWVAVVAIILSGVITVADLDALYRR
jgi:predicted secreted protein